MCAASRCLGTQRAAQRVGLTFPNVKNDAGASTIQHSPCFASLTTPPLPYFYQRRPTHRMTFCPPALFLTEGKSIVTDISWERGEATSD